MEKSTNTIGEEMATNEPNKTLKILKDFLDFNNYEEEHLEKIVEKAKIEGFTFIDYEEDGDYIEIGGKYYDVEAIKNILRAKYHSPKINKYTIEELIDIFKEEEFDEIEIIEAIEEVGIDNLEELKDEIECILADKHYCLELEDAFSFDELQRIVDKNMIERVDKIEKVDFNDYVKLNYKYYKKKDIINFLEQNIQAGTIRNYID